MTFIERRHVRSLAVLLFCFFLLGTAMPSAADAQVWPTKQVIRVVVPLTAGSATDVLARVVFNQASKQIGQTVIVENRPGAAGTIGTTVVAKSDPDGYTILVNSSSHIVYPSTFANLSFDVLADFSATTPLASIPTVMVVAPSKGYQTLADFIAAAKAKPGSMTDGSGRIGNLMHLVAERLRLGPAFGVRSHEQSCHDRSASIVSCQMPRYRSIVVMKRHGATVTGRNLIELVFRSNYRSRDAELQLQALSVGKIESFSDTEIELASKYPQATLVRAWQYWCSRLQSSRTD
jgi:hypothetical protein